MSLRKRTAVAVFAVREVQLPVGSWKVGDENGMAREVLTQRTDSGTKLPKETLSNQETHTHGAAKILKKLPWIEESTMRGRLGEPYSYRYRRFDAVEKQVQPMFYTISSSTDTARNSFQWVPLTQVGEYLDYPDHRYLQDIVQRVDGLLAEIDAPFGGHPDQTANEIRKSKRKATSDKIADEHQTLDDF